MSDLILTDDEVKHGCGAGQGARCCKFLLRGGVGWVCGRETELAARLIMATDMMAQRLPTEPYPQCQLTVTAQS
jgi:hypothetical protein